MVHDRCSPARIAPARCRAKPTTFRKSGFSLRPFPYRRVRGEAKASPRQSRRVFEPIPRQHIPAGCEGVGGRAALPRGFDGNAEPVPLDLQRGVLGNALPERPKNAQKMKQRGQSWKPYRKTHSRPSQLQMVPSVLDEQVDIKHGPGLFHPSSESSWSRLPATSRAARLRRRSSVPRFLNPGTRK